MKEVVFRVVLLVVVLLALFAWVGWLTFDHTANNATIKLDTGKIEQAVETSVEKSRDFVDRAVDAAHEAGQKVSHDTHEHSTEQR
jgi:hypothetical protein